MADPTNFVHIQSVLFAFAWASLVSRKMKEDDDGVILVEAF